jgi:hypothetical protein
MLHSFQLKRILISYLDTNLGPYPNMQKNSDKSEPGSRSTTLEVTSKATASSKEYFILRHVISDFFYWADSVLDSIHFRIMDTLMN